MSSSSSTDHGDIFGGGMAVGAAVIIAICVGNCNGKASAEEEAKAEAVQAGHAEYTVNPESGASTWRWKKSCDNAEDAK